LDLKWIIPAASLLNVAIVLGILNGISSPFSVRLSLRGPQQLLHRRASREIVESDEIDHLACETTARYPEHLDQQRNLANLKILCLSMPLVA